MKQAELQAELQARSQGRLQGMCAAYILEELESREISASNNDFDGIIKSMCGDKLNDILEASASKAVSEYQTEVAN